MFELDLFLCVYDSAVQAGFYPPFLTQQSSTAQRANILMILWANKDLVSLIIYFTVQYTLHVLLDNVSQSSASCGYLAWQKACLPPIAPCVCASVVKVYHEIKPLWSSTLTIALVFCADYLCNFSIFASSHHERGSSKPAVVQYSYTLGGDTYVFGTITCVLFSYLIEIFKIAAFPSPSLKSMNI